MSAHAGEDTIRLILAAPRGFCAGVVRAIEIVERALTQYGPPVYVRHEIVHNRYVVESLKQKGAIFVEELDEIPDGGHPVIFSAHGVPRSVPEEAKRRELFYLDATCPLVSKVHMEAARHFEDGYEIVLIGHAGHPEVVGTMGQLPQGAISLLESEEDARRFVPKDPAKLAYITQTTLSVEDTRSMIRILEERFPEIHGPHKEDICYATTNRQEAVKILSPLCEVIIVVGAPNSSNSQRLVEVAQTQGCPTAVLVQRAADLDWSLVGGARVIGLTAGASAPEILVQEVVSAFHERHPGRVSVETIQTCEENVSFKLPRQLRSSA